MSLEIGKRYRVTFEGEYEGRDGVDNHHRFKAPNDFLIGCWLRDGEFEFETAFEKEPPVGSVAVDIEKFVWQRVGPRWYRVADGSYATAYGLTWNALNKSNAFGPVKVVYRAEEKADAS